MKTFGQKKEYEAESVTIEAYKEQGVEVARYKKTSSPKGLLIVSAILITIVFIAVLFATYLYLDDVQKGAEIVIKNIQELIGQG